MILHQYINSILVLDLRYVCSKSPGILKILLLERSQKHEKQKCDIRILLKNVKYPQTYGTLRISLVTTA